MGDEQARREPEAIIDQAANARILRRPAGDVMNREPGQHQSGDITDCP